MVGPCRHACFSKPPRRAQTLTSLTTEAIQDVKVWLASEQKEVDFKSLFPESDDDRTVVQFARSFG